MLTAFHIQKSKERTGKDFKEMHEWLDNCETDPHRDFDEYLLQHRIERHTPEGIEFISKRWGKAGLIEAIKHLQEDGYEITYEVRGNNVDVMWGSSQRIAQWSD